MRMAAAALNQKPCAWLQNRSHILEAIAEARAQGVELLCLPELCISGYDCMDAFYAPSVMARSWEMLESLIPETQGLGVTLGLPLLFEGQRYNAIAWVAQGRLEGLAVKQVLAQTAVYYESRWFRPWEPGRIVSYRGYPLGQRVYDYQGWRLGFEICEEAWVQPRAALDTAIAGGAQIILNPSASHFFFDKYHRRRALAQEAALRGVYYLFANQLGNPAGRLIYDGHTLIIDPHHPTRFLEGAYLALEPCTMVSTVMEAAPPITLTRHQQFEKALILGLWDVLRHTKTRGFVVSLSGGLDSSTCAYLVGKMIRLAVSTWGLQGVYQRLDHIPGLDQKTSVEGLTAALLTLAYQKTEHSSQATQQSAECLARALGATYYCFEIDSWVQDIRQTIEACLERTLTWSEDDLALQNLQARARSPSIWLIANVNQQLLLATNNRSECSVGYATMDGDTSGCFSPLAGIDKPFLQAYVAWAAAEEPALRAVLALPPSAELRPESQRDEADLMPYPVLNAIEGYFCADHWITAEELLGPMLKAFPSYSESQLLFWIEKFLRLWTKNQWKRERFAPSFQVDRYGIDPKSDSRYPLFLGD